VLWLVTILVNRATGVVSTSQALDALASRSGPTN
jgi:hypothetical protein